MPPPFNLTPFSEGLYRILEIIMTKLTLNRILRGRNLIQLTDTEITSMLIHFENASAIRAFAFDQGLCDRAQMNKMMNRLKVQGISRMGAAAQSLILLIQIKRARLLYC